MALDIAITFPIHFLYVTVDSIEVNMEEGKLTAVWDVDSVYLAHKEQKKDPQKEKEDAEKEAASIFVYFGNPSGCWYLLREINLL